MRLRRPALWQSYLLVGALLTALYVWVPPFAWTRKPLAAWMASHIGMPVRFDDPAWDETYVAHLARLVRPSIGERTSVNSRLSLAESTAAWAPLNSASAEA